MISETETGYTGKLRFKSTLFGNIKTEVEVKIYAVNVSTLSEQAYTKWRPLKRRDLPQLYYNGSFALNK